MIEKLSEITDGKVAVVKKNGEVQTVKVASASRPFIGQFGRYEGEECVIVVPKKEIPVGTVSRRGAYYDGTHWYRSEDEYRRENED